MRIGAQKPIFSVALVVPSFRLRERHRASGAAGLARASQGYREGWANEGGRAPRVAL